MAGEVEVDVFPSLCLFCFGVAVLYHLQSPLLFMKPSPPQPCTCAAYTPVHNLLTFPRATHTNTHTQQRLPPPPLR
jgi:hypothetical protein